MRFIATVDMFSTWTSLRIQYMNRSRKHIQLTVKRLIYLTFVNLWKIKNQKKLRAEKNDKTSMHNPCNIVIFIKYNIFMYSWCVSPEKKCINIKQCHHYDINTLENDRRKKVNVKICGKMRKNHGVKDNGEMQLFNVGREQNWKK